MWNLSGNNYGLQQLWWVPRRKTLAAKQSQSAIGNIAPFRFTDAIFLAHLTGELLTDIPNKCHYIPSKSNVAGTRRQMRTRVCYRVSISPLKGSQFCTTHRDRILKNDILDQILRKKIMRLGNLLRYVKWTHRLNPSFRWVAQNLFVHLIRDRTMLCWDLQKILFFSS